MSSDKVERLISRLLAQTKQGRIAWEPESPKSFRVDFEDFSIRVAENAGSMWRTYEIDIINEQGIVIEGISSEDLIFIESAELENLYNQARNVGLKVDETLDYILTKVG